MLTLDKMKMDRTQLHSKQSLDAAHTIKNGIIFRALSTLDIRNIGHVIVIVSHHTFLSARILERTLEYRRQDNNGGRIPMTG